MKGSREKGFVLITTAVCAIAAVGMTGLAIDLGRLYVAKNEMQTYADSASLAAAAELDGTPDGLGRAAAALSDNRNRWKLGRANFGGTLLDFGREAAGPWFGEPNPASGFRFARVRASGTLPLFLLPLVVSETAATVSAAAVAGQVPKTEFTQGIFPFSPYAHDSASPNFGFTPGEQYTLRWPASPKVGHNLCAGDDAQQWVDRAGAGSSGDRGYIEESSSSIIRKAIEQEFQTRPLAIGGSVNMTGGNKQTQQDSLVRRINQDTDPDSSTFSLYDSAATGNGRRLVAAVVNSGPPDYKIVGFALFFLLPSAQYDGGGNNPFCAEYVGPYVQGSRHQGAGGPGAYSLRLLR